MTKNTLRILIVEDDLILAASLEENLNDLGYKDIIKVKNSDEAFKTFNEKPPSLAILDIKLNGSQYDGIEIASRFNKVKEIPFIFLSSFDDDEIRAKAKKTGPAAYLLKPVSIKQIDIAIEFALNAFYSPNTKQLNNNIICPLSQNQEYIFIKGNLSYEKVFIKDICNIEAAASSCVVNTHFKKYVISTNLRSLLAQLLHPDIIRIHRSHAINLASLHAFDEHDVYIMQNNKVMEIPIGNAYKENLMKFLPRIKTKKGKVIRNN